MKGEIIHYTRDALGGILVIDYRKHRVMTFDSVFEQSKIDRRKPHLPVHEYSRAMLLPVAFSQPAHVTVLGLGGGVMASALLHLLPDCQVRAVELRPSVLQVAREYFSLPHSANLTVTLGDARDAIGKAPDSSTDLILADMYNSDRMSPTQAQREFIRQCSRVLSDSGWLTINYHRTPDLNSPLFRQLRGEFAVLLLFKSKTNNTVLFASKQPFEALHTKDPALVSLEKRLPIDWRRLMARVSRLT
ncbi:methyltransferase domain-containing protein [Marinobacter panjinensis]|uniref:Methyltransferase domain-containing protein n=1 Tax=Marinobacter panjinensis TaxID=2576384 RepID=A0A4U6R5I5_9GAMM|nr:methyltransferase domain-containing protein [Marinobacter panjinensis]MCR8914134.1 methyltransferase domain-containing protein [Marinobacter panjinensis]TKV69007.1 methyltransferase domain-containing protein [Marinobacter panjinensis]